MKYIMGIDLGTTGCKATVFDREGQVRCQSYLEYPIENYTGTIDPGMVWESTCQVIRECTEKYPVVEAVCITSFGESVVLLDEEKNVLCESMLYTNNQASDEWRELNHTIGQERIYQITGHISHPMYTVNRLLWYKKHCPQIYDKTRHFLFFSGYAAAKLGGKIAAEDTHAARSMAYDVKNKTWSWEILDSAGIDVKKLPPIVSAGERLGTADEAVCERVGFQNRPQIIAGGQDQPCVALGMGAVHGGDAVYGLGTVECLSVVLDEYQQSEAMKNSHLICAPHVVPGKFLTYGVLYSGGNVIKELRNRLYEKEKDRRDVYDIMFEEMKTVHTGLTFIPHLYGTGTPQMDPNASGCLCGLRIETRRGDIVRAAIEGLAFDMRTNIENMREANIPVTRLKAAGGGAQSAAAMQVRADALQEEVVIPEDVQAGARGTFFIAAKALGWLGDYAGIASYAGQRETVVHPQPAKREEYEGKYKKYKSLSGLFVKEEVL